MLASLALGELLDFRSGNSTDLDVQVACDGFCTGLPKVDKGGPMHAGVKKLIGNWASADNTHGLVDR